MPSWTGLSCERAVFPRFVAGLQQLHTKRVYGSVLDFLCSQVQYAFNGHLLIRGQVLAESNEFVN